MLNIEWTHPFNKQEDIKYYQVFRRARRDEGFKLIKQYNFQDARPAIPLPEKIPEYLIIRSQYPVSSCQDEEFTLDSNFIYSVCSVDAHGMSSGYSEQFQVRWDRSTGKLDTRMLSEAGAAKTIS